MKGDRQGERQTGHSPRRSLLDLPPHSAFLLALLRVSSGTVDIKKSSPHTTQPFFLL